jgi:serine/threonine protein kinase
MADLAILIKNKPLSFPTEIKVCEELKDVLKKMLTVDIKKRIEWKDLFNHPVTSYLSKKRKSEVEL